MISVFVAEALKLRRSLVLLVAATGPVMVFALGVMMQVTGNGPEDWTMHTMSSAAIWAFFLLPMTAVGATALLAQLEHAPGTWSHSLALPIPKWQVFFAKAVLALLLMAVISALVALAALAAGFVGSALAPDHAIAGSYDAALAFRLYGLMYLAGFLVTAIQWTLAMRFSAFAVPVSIGIGGTFVAVAATSAKSGIYFPWLMPLNVLAQDPARIQIAVGLGLAGGLAIFAGAIFWLARRDWA